MAAAGPRKQAQLVGAKRYFTGVPCVRGHVADRFVSTKACTVCADSFTKAWVKQNAEWVNARGLAWRVANPERYAAQRRAHYLAHQAQYYGQSKKRKLRQKQRMPAWADPKAIQAIYSDARRRRCLGEDVVVDHVIPIHGKTVSGLHVHTNLQIMSATLNIRKSNIFLGDQL